MKEITLSKGFVTMVDDEDYDRVSQHCWHANVQPNGYVRAAGRINNKLVSMHRFILGAKPGQIVDHINSNPLDNRRSNLRFCTPSGNARNKKVGKRSKSGIKGISYCKRTGRWRADIQILGKSINLGRFQTIKEASAAYDQKALQLFGEFARINGPCAK